MLLREGKERDASTIVESKTLFTDLIRLAAYVPQESGAQKFSVGKNVNLGLFIVPTEASLTVSLPNSSSRSLLLIAFFVFKASSLKSV